MRPTHVMKGRLLYQVHQFKCKLHPKILSESIQSTVWAVWVLGPQKLAYKVYHRSRLNHIPGQTYLLPALILAPCSWRRWERGVHHFSLEMKGQFSNLQCSQAIALLSLVQSLSDSDCTTISNLLPSSQSPWMTSLLAFRRKLCRSSPSHLSPSRLGLCSHTPSFPLLPRMNCPGCPQRPALPCVIDLTSLPCSQSFSNDSFLSLSCTISFVFPHSFLLAYTLSLTLLRTLILCLSDSQHHFHVCCLQALSSHSLNNFFFLLWWNRHNKMYHCNYFKVSNPVTLNIWLMLCNRHHCQVLELSPNRNLVPIKHLLPISTPTRSLVTTKMIASTGYFI